MKKTALFVFNEDPVCFIHVLLNALDLKGKGHDARVVIEGAATRLIPELLRADNPLHPLWEKARAAGLIDGVCRACSAKMGTLETAESERLGILDDMSGHPGMARYQEDGFNVITF